MVPLRSRFPTSVPIILKEGSSQALHLLKPLEEWENLYSDDYENTSTNEQREQGCISAIQATRGAVTLAELDYDNDSAAIAIQQTAAVLQRVGDLAGVFGTNLFSAEGAAQAIKNANKQGTIKVASFDAPEQAIVDLRNGIIDLVIAQKPADMVASP